MTNLEDILTKHAVVNRGSMKNRAISEFGFFVKEMQDFLVFGDYSESQSLKEFQQSIDPDKYKGSNWSNYVELFKDYANIEVFE